MTKDNETPKKYNLRNSDKNLEKKQFENSDDSDSDSDWTPGCEDEEIDNSFQYQKFLQKLFPSKNQSEKVKQMKNMKKLLNKQGDKKKKKVIKSYKDEIEEEKRVMGFDDESDNEDELYENFMTEEGFIDPKKMKFNIVFTVSDKDMLDNSEEYYIDEEREEDEEWDRNYKKYLEKDEKNYGDEEEEEESSRIKKKSLTVNKGSKKFKLKERVLVKKDEWRNEYVGKITKVCKNNKYDILLESDKFDKKRWKKVESKYLKSFIDEEEYENILCELKGLIDEKKKEKKKKSLIRKFEKYSSAYEKMMKEKKEKEENKHKQKNSITFRNLVKEKSASNDFIYFKKLPLEEQNLILENLKCIRKHIDVEKPYRLSLIESKIPIEFKSNALKKINMLNYMDPSSGEYYKVKQWVDTFMRIPFNKYSNLPLTIDDGIEKCSEFMEEAKKILDDCVYGLEDAKMQILQMIGQWIANPESIGSAIAIAGPPGTGKTTLVKEGISKILKRPFAFLALGGATDSSFLEGHSYTYEGSSWGKIVDILIQSKSMNPVIYFDELDKISATPKGEEITGILTHLTDTTQNDKFHDKYFSSIDFNLSKCLFIFSYNVEKDVNPILKDRMYRITTKGYDTKQKIVIATKHLIPKIRKNVKFEEGEIIISDDTIGYIVDNLTDREKGVRNLKRCLEIIHTKINLYRLMKPDSQLFEKEKSIEVAFPFTVTEEIVKKLIKKVDNNGPPLGMYI